MPFRLESPCQTDQKETARRAIAESLPRKEEAAPRRPREISRHPPVRGELTSLPAEGTYMTHFV